MKNPLTTLFPQRLRTRAPSPFQAFAELENEMDRLLQRPLGWETEFNAYDFSPSCDLTENSKEFIAQFDIPGVKKDQVKIEIENNRLTVSGERKTKREEKDERKFISESYSGSFMRSFSLPQPVDENKVDAHYEDGLLTIKIPKIETSKAKEVKIH